MVLPEIIAIGSNTLDILIQIDDILRFELFDKDIIKKYTAIEYSRKLNVKDVKFVPGGSGANIAANCSMLGLKSAYIGVMGNDFSAEICLSDLKKRGVDLSQVIQTDKDCTALSIILKTQWGKDRSILAYKGANNLLRPSDIREDFFGNVKAFAWTSLTTDESCKAIEKAITFTKNKGGMVFAAPSMSIIKNAPDWAKILISNSDVVSMNLEEAQEFTGENKKTLMIKNFLEMGIKLISITDGPHGSIISDGKTIINSGIYSGGKEVQDTTGAGDAFLTGILVSCLNNFSLEKTSKMATAMSYLECLEFGVREGLPASLQELENFVNNNTIKQVISEII